MPHPFFSTFPQRTSQLIQQQKRLQFHEATAEFGFLWKYIWQSYIEAVVHSENLEYYARDRKEQGGRGIVIW